MSRPTWPLDGVQRHAAPDALKNSGTNAATDLSDGTGDTDFTGVSSGNDAIEVLYPGPIEGGTTVAPSPMTSVEAQAPSPTLVTTAGSNLSINLVWDTSVASAPAGFMTDVIAATHFIESQLGNDVTLNIDVGYGEVAGNTLGADDLGESETYLTSLSYSSLVADLTAASSGDATDKSVLASLPATAPISGTYYLTVAQAQALGVDAANGGELDGYVGFATASNFTYGVTNTSGTVASGTYDMFATVAHEMTEDMGRIMLVGNSVGNGAGYTLLDMLHYSAAGTQDFVQSTPGYFTVNGGITDLGDFNTIAGGDPGDWASSVTDNSFDAYSSPGVINAVTSNDLTEMDALGWNSAIVSSAVRTLDWTGAADTNFANALNWDDVTDLLNPAATGPDGLDTGVFTGGGNISGDGTAAVLQFIGNGAWVLGSGSSLTVDGAAGVSIGDGGAGALELSGGATIVSEAAADAVSGSALLSANLAVDGMGSRWQSQGELIVGGNGLGDLAIQSGGSVNAGGGLVIANTGSASGSSVTLTGSQSNLLVTGTLTVGEAGSGALSLSQGASVTAGALDVAAATTGDGEVSLAGTGSTLTITGAMTLGGQAAGELSVLGGAHLTVGGGVVGSSKTAPGNLDIEGAGSFLTINTGSLVVGANGPAEFTLGIGASLSGEVANGQFGVVSEYGTVDPATDPNDGTQNVGFGNSLIYDYYVANSGTIKITSGTATFYTPLVTDETNAADGSTSGLWVIGAHETLVMNATSVDATQVFDLTSASAATLVIGQVPQASTTQTDTFNGQTMPALTGSVAPGAANVLPGWDAPIENFQAGDLILLRGLSYGSATAAGDVVTVWSGAPNTSSALGSLTFLTKSGAASPTQAALAATQINSLACFAEGTRVATNDGWVKVEDLRVGAAVRTLPVDPARSTKKSGQCEPIVWIGSRTVDCTRHPRPETVWPVRIARGAFADNVPSRELYLSPDHAIFVNGVLVPVKLLINGTSIEQVKRNRVTYYHVELPDHAIILADGLPVESYLDTGDRSNFTATGTIRLHPDFSTRLTPDAAMLWETKGAAPLVTTGARLTAARRMVAGKAKAA